MNKLIDRITRLLSIKSLVTLILTAVFAYLAIIRIVSADQVVTIFTTVIAFYFGTQKIKEE